MGNCKFFSILGGLLMIMVASLWAGTPTQVSFVDGEVSLKPASGASRDLNPGDKLNTGDTVRTGADGVAELDQKGVILKLSPKTVFTLTERESGGKQRDVVAVAVGSMKMKYEKLSGTEPLIRTASCSAGVRGTEISVFSGEDGSSLIAVDSGSVEISAEGKTVSLEVGEAVEVRPGQAPGDKFTLHSDQVDYRTWNDDRVKSMLADPVKSLGGLRAQLESYIKDASNFDAAHSESSARLEAERQKLLVLKKDQGEEAFNKYRDEVVTPLSFETAFQVLNTRYFALAAYSLRRYVAGRLYLQLKPLALTGNPVWTQFRKDYQDFLDSYEHSIVPHLVEADF